MSIVKDESRKVFILTKQEDFFNSIRNWFREDFHSIQAKSIFDIHTFVQKGLHAGLIMIDTALDDLEGLCRKTKKIFPISPIVLLPTEEQQKQYTEFLDTKLADLMITQESLFFGSKHIILFALDSYTKSIDMIYMQKEKNELNKLIMALRNQSLNNLTFENDTLFKSFMQILSGFPFDFEVFYFSNHLRTSNLLIKAIAEELGLDKSKIISAITANFILQYILNSMPIYLTIIDPEEMPIEYQRDFFQLYIKKITPMKNMRKFQKIYHYLQQIWEHYDGTGYPLQLSGNSINEISQIILLANKYHNYSSRLIESDLREIIVQGHKTFDVEQIRLKFDFANKMIMHQSSIFAPELIHALKNKINEKSNYAFIPPHEEITMKSLFDYRCLEVFDYIAKKNKEKKEGTKEIKIGEETEEKSVNSDNFYSESKPREVSHKQNIIIELLEVGDFILEPIRNRNGQVVIKEETEITATTLKTLKKLLERDVIDSAEEISCKIKD